MRLSVSIMEDSERQTYYLLILFLQTSYSSSSTPYFPALLFSIRSKEQNMGHSLPRVPLVLSGYAVLTKVSH